MKGRCGNCKRKIGPKSCYFLGLRKNDRATLDQCPVNASTAQNKCCFVCSPWKRSCSRCQSGNWFTWKMLSLIWKLRRIPPPPFPVPPPARRWSPSVRYCLRLVCPPFFLLSTLPHCVKGLTCALAGRMGSRAARLCYSRLARSPGPCLALRKDLLCWDTGQYHAVL